MNALNEQSSRSEFNTVGVLLPVCPVGLNIYAKWGRTAFRLAVLQIWVILTKHFGVCSSCWTGQAFPVWSRNEGSGDPTYKQAFPKDTVLKPTHLASPSQNQHWLPQWPRQLFFCETVWLKAVPLYFVEMLMKWNKIVPSENTLSFHGCLWNFPERCFGSCPFMVQYVAIFDFFFFFLFEIILI